MSGKLDEKLNEKIIVAYPGIKGAFSHLASVSAFPNGEMISFPTFEDVARAVRESKVDYGIIPFENSFTGEVGEVSGLLRKFDIYVNGTLDLKIEQNLLGVKGAMLSDIKTVYSHPQAISQSIDFIRERKFNVISSLNTAIAAKYVSDENDKSKGAIASSITAELYGLDIIESNINTSHGNTTRFIIISKNYNEKGDYFQFLFTIRHEIGSLAKLLTVIAEKGFNMLNIKSHPIIDQPWHYYFHVELEGDLSKGSTQRMLDDIKKYCIELRVLGGYNKIYTKNLSLKDKI
ncbi:prephenate dehydratase [Fusobacterium sp. PH5-44]|uniref:prephenate dehydratase n=1 Tax=unclassified Fusobacterium TaxID=2648384 RepID=UPI003D1C580B